MRIPLVKEFRFVHEPRGLRESEQGRSQARAEALDQLTSRILLSHGGAFLLAGYRGVGKTTLVNTLIARVQAHMKTQQTKGQDVLLIHIPLTLARPVPPDKLMYRLIGCLHEELSRQGLLSRLSPRLATDLDLAVRRTSMSIGIKDMQSTEQSGTVSVQTPKLFDFGAKIGGGGKRRRDRTQDAKYLAYDDVAAEQDLIRVARFLTRDGGVPLRRTSRWRFWQRPKRVRLKLFFVFDEMDKLDESSGSVDTILQTLKTLLTTSGITFLFVTGRDLYDKYRRDVSQGDSVYESVFTFVQYVPALWDGVAALCDPLIEEETRTRQGTVASAAYDAFRHYLTFRGRGIPRRILRGLHDFVTVENNEQAYLDIGSDDLRRFRFFADVENALRDAERKLIEPGLIDHEAHRIDQERLALRYLTDWILAQRTGRFTIESAIAASRSLSTRTAPSETAAPRVVRGLIEALMRHALLERVEESSATAKVVVVEGAIASETYRMPWPRLIELGHRRRDEDAPGTGGQATDNAGLPDRYAVQRRLSEGAFGVVYEARDLFLGRRVAIKVYAEGLPDEGREALRREARALSGLNHPNIVEYFEADFDAPQPFIVMNLIEGVSLRDLLQGQSRLAWPVAVTIVRAVLSALEHLHARDILWADAKPGNIMIAETGRVMMIDFGAALEIGETNRTSTQTAIGTPRFMAPERIRGETTGPQADLFSVGAILFEMLHGKPAFRGDTPMDTLRAVMMGDIAPVSDAEVPADVAAAMRWALEPDLASRYAAASDMLGDLPAGASDAELAVLVRESQQQEEVASAAESAQTMVMALPPDRDIVSRKSKASDAAIDTDGEMPVKKTVAPPPAAPVPQAPAPVPAQARPDDEATQVLDPWDEADEESDEPSAATEEMAGAPDADEDPFALPETEFTSLDALGDAQSSDKTIVATTLTRWMLEITDGGLNRSVEIDSADSRSITIGRSASNEIMLSDAAASRYHAQIRASVDAEHLTLDELNTPNGVLVNGQLVYGLYDLSDGDEIRIGSAVLTVSKAA